MLNLKKRGYGTGFKPAGKSSLVLLLITLILISTIIPQAVFVDLPDNNGGSLNAFMFTTIRKEVQP